MSTKRENVSKARGDPVNNNRSIETFERKEIGEISYVFEES